MTLSRILLVPLCFLLTACGAQGGGHLAESWANDTRSISEIEPVEHKANVVLYRDAASLNQQTAANVYIDNEFITSLRKNRFKHVAICPGVHEFKTIFTLADPAYRDKHRSGQSFDVPTDGMYYFKAIVQDGRIVFEQVSEAQAHLALKNSLEQAHALSRIDHKNQQCHSKNVSH